MHLKMKPFLSIATRYDAARRRAMWTLRRVKSSQVMSSQVDTDPLTFACT